MKKLIYTSVLALLTVFTLNAQTVLTLEECIDIALKNNIDIKRARNNAISAKAGLTQSKFNFLPSLNAGASHSWNEGLQFDNTSGLLVNTTTLSGGGSVNASLNIFNGFSNVLTLQQNRALYEASEQSVRGNIQNTEASIVGAFLNVVSNRESLKIAEQTKGLLQEQLSREEKREAAGVGNMEQVYNFRSRIATQELTIVGFRNSLETAKLTLIQLLLLDPADDYEFQGVTSNDAELEAEMDSYGSIYDRAMAFSPSIKSAELNLAASKKGLKISQYAWMPQLSVFASYGSNWSSNLRDFQLDDDGEVIFYQIDPDTRQFLRDGMGDLIVGTNRNGLPLDIGMTAISDQLETNVSKFARFSLDIPLFTRFQNRTNVQRSKIQVLNNELNLEQAKNTMTNSVQQAYLNLVNAKSTYAAAKESLVNLDTSYEFAKTRYESGTIDFVTYLQSLNGKNNGELELARAKYQILFRKLIIDIFTGELDMGNN